MNVVVVLTAALAGGLGAATRFLVDGLIRQALGSRFPWGTLIINLTGSLALGFITGLLANAVLDQQTAFIIGSGLIGGYTTFSTASFETIRLLQTRRTVASAINGIGMLLAGGLLAFIGLALGMTG